MAQLARAGFSERTVQVAGVTHRYRIYLPVGYTPRTQWPVILFLHGAGERGLDGLRQTEVGLGPAIRRNPERYPAIVVFPQASPNTSWTGAPGTVAMAALDQTLRELSADRGRVYVTGLSMGGNGAWYLAYSNPGRFAAALVVCGFLEARGPFPGFVPPDSNAARVVARGIQKMPVWIYHGAADTVVPVSASRDIATVLRDQGSDVRYTELPGVGHNAWDAAYGSSEVATWLLAQRHSASTVATAGGSGGSVRIVSRGEERGLRPRLAVSLGPYAMSTEYQATGATTNSADGGNLFGGVSVAMGVSRRVSFDVEYRRVLDSDWSFKTLGLGVTARSAQRSGFYSRFALVRVTGQEPQTCAPPVTCPGSTGDAKVAFEAALGIDFTFSNHLAAGPRISWAQSFGGLPRYRLLGLGFQLSAF